MEFIKQMSVQAQAPGAIQSTGVQPVTITLVDAAGGPFTVQVVTDMSDTLANIAINASVWIRLDDTQPTMTVPTLGNPVSESTAAVITATVEQMDAPTAV